MTIPHANTSPQSVLAPQAAPRLSLESLLPIGQLQALLDSFGDIFPAVTAILDLDGKILQASGWQDICTRFHRPHPEACRNCTESDTFLARNVRPGEFVAYRCKNGLWDVVTPLHVGGTHVGNLYTGQFFYDDEDVDEAAFSAQARRFGFDHDAYLAALRRVPRVSRQRVEVVMGFLVQLTSLLSRLGLAQQQLANDLVERQRLYDALAAEQETRRALEVSVRESRRLESLGQLAGGIAHDFNNLLATVQASLEVARLEAPKDGDVSAALGQGLDAAARAADLTRQLLAYSGRGRFVIEPVDLAQLTAECVDALRPSLPRSASVSLEVAGLCPVIEADRSQLRLALTHLVRNAAEALGDKPGRVVVRARELEATAELLAANRLPNHPRPGRFAVVEVRDTGCGMDAATLERVFDPFFSTKLVGRGLGMAAVHGIVSNHGGALLLDTAVGQGTTVRALFPVAVVRPEAHVTPVPVPAPAPKPPTRAVGGRRGLVLIVDDEPLVASSMRRLVTRLGFEVQVAHGGVEGLALAQQHRAALSLAIIDLTMPDLSGTEVARRLKELAPRLPVVLSSGYDLEPIEADAATLGISGFLHKPFSLATLTDVLDRLVGPAPRA